MLWVVASCLLPSSKLNSASGEVLVFISRPGFLVLSSIVPIDTFWVIFVAGSSSSLRAKSCCRILVQSVSPRRADVVACIECFGWLWLGWFLFGVLVIFITFTTQICFIVMYSVNVSSQTGLVLISSTTFLTKKLWILHYIT